MLRVAKVRKPVCPLITGNDFAQSLFSSHSPPPNLDTFDGALLAPFVASAEAPDAEDDDEEDEEDDDEEDEEDEDEEDEEDEDDDEESCESSVGRWRFFELAAPSPLASPSCIASPLLPLPLALPLPLSPLPPPLPPSVAPSVAPPLPPPASAHSPVAAAAAFPSPLLLSVSAAGALKSGTSMATVRTS